MNVCPAIVSVPDRNVVDAFAATEYGTLPLPFPLVAPVSVIHPALVVADHVHPEATVTPTLPVAPDAAGDIDVGEMPGVQVGWK